MKMGTFLCMVAPTCVFFETKQNIFHQVLQNALHANKKIALVNVYKIIGLMWKRLLQKLHSTVMTLLEPISFSGGKGKQKMGNRLTNRSDKQ